MTEWIKVENRLPENDSRCIAYDGKDVLAVCYNKSYRFYTNEFSCTDGEFKEKVNNVTHWMPLPEKPND